MVHSVRGTARQRTFERYESIVRVHLVPTIGRIKLKTLTPAHVRHLYRAKLDAGLTPRSVLHVHRTLSKALRQATDDGLVPRNVAGLVKPPRPRSEEIRPLDGEQVRALFDAAKASGDRLVALYIVAVTTGMRRGELQELKWGNLDLDAGTLQARRSLSEPKGGWIFEAPKSGKGRSIRLTRKAISALRQLRKRQLEERLHRETGLWTDHGLVFPSTMGTPISGGNLNRSFEAVLERSGLPTVRFHDLRDTCATLLLRQASIPGTYKSSWATRTSALFPTSTRTYSPTWETPPPARWTPRSDSRVANRAKDRDLARDDLLVAEISCAATPRIPCTISHLYSSPLGLAVGPRGRCLYIGVSGRQ